MEEGFTTPPVNLDGHSGKTRAFLRFKKAATPFALTASFPTDAAEPQH